MACFDTERARNGGIQAINGLIQLHHHITRSYKNRDNYRLRMPLITDGPNL